MQYEVQALVFVEGKLTTVSSWKGNNLFHTIIEIYHLLRLGVDKLKVSLTF